jgi:glycerophosphoryl diester phosphodiesterase
VTMNPLLDPNARLVIAHRGNRVAAPENTLEALHQAADLGVDALEFDVRMSRDAVPVVIHDARVDRTTNGTGLVNAFSFAELRELDAGHRRRPAGNDRPLIPSLEEALAAFRQLPLVIEVKELAAAEATARFIRRFGLQDSVVVGSAQDSVMRWFYGSGLHCCAAMYDAMRWIPVALTGQRASAVPFEVLSITTTFRGVPIPVLRLARTAATLGIPTQVWTVNRPAIAVRLWRGGVAAIVTDDPAAMLEARRTIPS